MGQATPREVARNRSIDSLSTAVQMVSCMDHIHRAAIAAFDPLLDDRETYPWTQAYPAKALLTCAALYCKTVEDSTLDNPALASLCGKSNHYFHLLKCLIRLCSDVNEADADGGNVLHYLLKPLLSTRSASASVADEVRTASSVCRDHVILTAGLARFRFARTSSQYGTHARTSVTSEPSRFRR